MTKIRLLTIIALLSASFLMAQNNGGGCRKAIIVTPGTYIVDTLVMGAATYSNYPPFPTKAKWYKYTPTMDGLMTISSCNGGADTRLFLYVGSCDTLIQAGYNDDFCDVDPVSGDEYAASITKPVKANKTYFFEWDNAWEDPPTPFRFSFSLSLAAYVPRATQTCETASSIALGTTNVDSLFGFASRGDANRANWYKYTPTKNGKLSVTSCGIPVDTRVWMYRGICSNLVLINGSDDDCRGGPTDSIAVAITNQTVTAGTTYYFEWDDVGNDYDRFSFLMTLDVANGVEEERFSQSVTMSPNPASDYVNLAMNFEKSTDINVRIFNNMGQTIFTKKMPNILRGVTALDLSYLNTGVYIVEISDGQIRTNKKLVISH